MVTAATEGMVDTENKVEGMAVAAADTGTATIHLKGTTIATMTKMIMTKTNTGTINHEPDSQKS